ncbi:MAG: NAD(P)-dependent alcohol dehydrogenase [Flavobacteriia bacterium]|nr:NAD(P)-dependent alcohol dehydrogenase [Flavobacteriia bacterium]
MRVAEFNQYGGAERLQLSEHSEPATCSGQVKLRVMATGLNDFDWGMMRGKPYVLRIGAFKKPKYSVLGCDVAGEVAELGPGVTEWSVGDRVAVDLSDQNWGGFGEYTIAKADSLARIPDDMSFVEAATLPHSGVLALQAVRQIGGFRKGKHILINGAGGGSGHILIKMAVQAGMKVTAVDTTSKLNYLRKCGAEEVIDYTKENYFDRKDMFDLIIDLQGHGKAASYYSCLKKGGRMSLVGGASSTIIGVLFIGGLMSLFSSKKLLVLGHKPNASDIAQLMDLYSNGVYSPVVDSVYPLEEIQSAFEHYRMGQPKGKVVIDLSDK